MRPAARVLLIVEQNRVLLLCANVGAATRGSRPAVRSNGRDDRGRRASGAVGRNRHRECRA